LAFAISKPIRQRKPKGNSKIGIIPQPCGTQVLFISGANRIIRTAPREITTLPRKPKARYFSNGLVDSTGVWPLEAFFEDVLLDILLEYWLS